MPTAKRVLVLGASGIVGQYLRLTEPQDVSVVYQSRQPLPWADGNAWGNPTWQGAFTNEGDVVAMLGSLTPDIVINLAGENRPDVVERDPDAYDFINLTMPGILADWADTRPHRWLIHVSSQAVFGGTNAPYHAVAVSDDDAEPCNAYGQQKRWAEQTVLRAEQTLVVRLTFVLGIRPFPHCGRANPLESMFAHLAQRQVNDRWFSICWAEDAARGLWELVATLDPLDPLLARYLQRRRIFHLGSPVAYTRYALAVMAAMQRHIMQQGGEMSARSSAEALVESVKHDNAFPVPEYARRPVDTTFAPGSLTYTAFDDGLRQAFVIWRHTVDLWNLIDRAKELALYFTMNDGQAQTELGRGFHHHHAEVAKDFRDAQHRVRADASHGLTPSSGWDDMRLLQWYKATPAYCWELTAYHLDVGFNYVGMCTGIRDYLLHHTCRRVLVLGDGVGDLSIVLADAGLDAVYHDLLGSVTARFALFRMTRRYSGVLLARPSVLLTDDWHPPDMGSVGGQGVVEPVDAVVALDFFEHLPNVPAWARFVAAVLKPGGHFLAQNAFGIGDNAHEGSIPMHLVENNKYVTDWDSLLDSCGFLPQVGGWRRTLA